MLARRPSHSALRSGSGAAGNKRPVFGAQPARRAPFTARPSLPDIARKGPTDPVPSYAAVDATPLNKVIMALFRRKMVAAIGADSQLQGCARV